MRRVTKVMGIRADWAWLWDPGPGPWVRNPGPEAGPNRLVHPGAWAPGLRAPIPWVMPNKSSGGVRRQPYGKTLL